MIYATGILLFFSAILAIGKYDYEKSMVKKSVQEV
mgnify:FL=1